jgi:hypothetical protein
MAFLEIIMHEILSNYLRATHCFGLIESLALTLSLLDTYVGIIIISLRYYWLQKKKREMKIFLM